LKQNTVVQGRPGNRGDSRDPVSQIFPSSDRPLVRVHDVLITVRERLKMSIYSAFAESVRVNTCTTFAMRAKRSSKVRIC